ncbi:hypothetical protein M2103_002697 [Ereboglobus sp. PH5-5]|uniref:hypothetical protein n=1 Tax=Ereboglobus sp. PH5-5 TaxID=2940529 RepID=UPI0024057BF7|nr:hypothetical protein [Ereboglobus sp. PH5-5]MDF9834441.1 hypothetical protein [Ereboglobus sp. PH5-5]
MKTLHSILYLFGIIILSSQMNAQEANTPITCMAWPITDSFKWIQKGEIMLIDIKQSKKRITQSYVYVSQEGRQFALTSSISAMTKTIQEEIQENELSDFLKKDFSNFASKTYPAQNTYLLNNKYLEGYLKAMKEEGRGSSHDLSKYCQEPDVKIERNLWSGEYCTINDAGIVFKWTISGRLSRFSINKIEMTELAHGIPMPLRF